MSQTIGERLKSARESKGTSLEEAARATKVQKTILHAIETNRVQEQLDPTYAKIFLKKYAVYLGLDSTAIAQEFVSVYGPIPERSLYDPDAMAAKQSTPTLRQNLVTIITGTLAVVLVLGLVYVAGALYRNFPLTKKKPKPAAAAKVQPAQPKPAAVAPAAAEQQQPENSKWVVPKGQPLKLTVRAKTDVWMQVKADGAVIFQNVLAKGTSESWTAKDGIEIWSGNAGAMSMSLNGKTLPSLGNGVKKGIRVTHQGLKSK
jgi:cytoskeletal protein RodZ